MTTTTLAIIKPDAVSARHTGTILARMEAHGLTVVGLRMLQLTHEQAAAFYAVHRERPFYNNLVSFMSSGPVVVLALQGENAIVRYRELMGATNPADAAPGTLRADFATSIDHNAVHGSDAPETAAEELAFFFTDDQLVQR